MYRPDVQICITRFKKEAMIFHKEKLHVPKNDIASLKKETQKNHVFVGTPQYDNQNDSKFYAPDGGDQTTFLQLIRDLYWKNRSNQTGNKTKIRQNKKKETKQNNAT